MMKTRDQQLKQKIRYRDRIIIVLFLFLAIAIIGLARAPHMLDVYQPPDLRYGTLSKAGTVPDTTVYSFTESIFDALMTWTEDGEVDYVNNRKSLSAFFTPNFKRWLKHDYQERLHSTPNELSDRVRYISVMPGVKFSKKNVVSQGNNRWIVYLDRQVDEYIDDRKVKTLNARYPIVVVKRKISRQHNPWRLAIDGLDGEISRIEVQVADSKVTTDE